MFDPLPHAAGQTLKGWWANLAPLNLFNHLRDSGGDQKTATEANGTITGHELDILILRTSVERFAGRTLSSSNSVMKLTTQLELVDDALRFLNMVASRSRFRPLSKEEIGKATFKELKATYSR